VEKCKWPWATVAAILAGLVLAGVVSWHLLSGTLPAYIVWGIPLAACGIAGGLRVAVETVRRLGGVGDFFCGGRRVVAALLGRSPPPVPATIETGGPFSVSRHPVYSATLGAYLLVALALPRLALAVVLVAVWVWLAAVVEERFLSMHPDYREYARATPRLAPIRTILYGCGLYRTPSS